MAIAKYIAGYSVDGSDKEAWIVVDNPDDLILVFSRDFIPSDTRGLSLGNIKKKKVKIMAATQRKGNRVVTNIRLSKEVAYVVMKLLQENLNFEK